MRNLLTRENFHFTAFYHKDVRIARGGILENCALFLLVILIEIYCKLLTIIPTKHIMESIYIVVVTDRISR